MKNHVEDLLSIVETGVRGEILMPQDSSYDDFVKFACTGKHHHPPT